MQTVYSVYVKDNLNKAQGQSEEKKKLIYVCLEWTFGTRQLV